MRQLKVLFKIMWCLLIVTPVVQAAKLAVVIDDFGYREHNEKQIIALPYPITVAVLPNSPNGVSIATLAHQHNKDVIIHLPMAPIGKQPLEIDTLFPSMTQSEIHRIISQAVNKVPYAIGLNNHMGSLMTSDLAGMQKVMNSLSDYSLFFLDSKTIAKSKAIEAAIEYRVPTVTRDVFLDDSQELSAVAHQFDLAVQSARKHGSAVAIGHPYNSTVKVLQEKLPLLPDDIELVYVRSLVKEPQKIKLSELVEQYKIEVEQGIFEYMIITESNKKPD